MSIIFYVCNDCNCTDTKGFGPLTDEMCPQCGSRDIYRSIDEDLRDKPEYHYDIEDEDE